MEAGPLNNDLTYNGKFRESKTEFYLMEYGAENFSYKKVDIEDITPKASNNIRWIQVKGISDVDSIKKLAQKFNIHNLTIKAMLNLKNRSELQSTGEKMTVVFNVPRWIKENGDFEFEKITIFRLRELKTIITFEENPKSLFSKLIKMAENNQNKIRTGPVDQMLFLVLESVLNKYFSTISTLSDKLREYGIELNEKNVNPDLFNKLHRFKGKVMRLIDSIEPVKLAVDKGIRFRIEEHEEYSVIHARILSQHLDNILDQLERLEDRCGHSFDLALSLNDYKMNEIMKKLTIIATIFLPLSFIAGIYGMNFKLMPELQVKYGYFYSLGLMLLVAIGILLYFKKKKWL